MPSGLYAQRLDWKLEDFKPLTKLPWDEDLTTPVDTVILAIFREPDFGVRMLLLDEYLHAIPVEKLGAALNHCLAYEGTQSPDELVEFFISIWAKRDPGACWKRTKELLKVAGIEDRWLNYDGWVRGSRITVQNRDAIKASKFWLTSRAFSTFHEGVEKSNRPTQEREKYLKECDALWMAAFGKWPSKSWLSYTPKIPTHLSRMFRAGPEGRREFIFDSHDIKDIYLLEIAVRRFIKAVPSEAPQVIEHLANLKWEGQGDEKADIPPMPSRTIFEVWADADLAGMMKWAEGLAVGKTESMEEREHASQSVYIPKGILMARIDEKKREQWLDKARERSELDALMAAWADFAPKAALDAAVKFGDAEILARVLRHAPFGPQRGHPRACFRNGI